MLAFAFAPATIAARLLPINLNGHLYGTRGRAMTIELHPNHVSDRDPRRGWWRTKCILRRALLAVFILLILVIGVAVILLRTEPGFWHLNQQFLQSHTDEQLNAMADNLEARILGALRSKRDQSKIARPAVDSTLSDLPPEVPGAGPDSTVVHITFDEVNAWLASRAHQWSTYRGYRVPESVADPMLTADEGRLVAAFRYKSQGFSQVFTTTIDPQFRGDGHARLKLINTTAGKLPIPARGIAAYVEHHLGNDAWARKIAGWLDELPDHDVQLKFKGEEDHKRVYIMGYAVREGGIYVAMKLDERDRGRGGARSLVTAEGE